MNEISFASWNIEVILFIFFSLCVMFAVYHDKERDRGYEIVHAHNWLLFA